MFTIDAITYFQLDLALERMRDAIKAGDDNQDLRQAYESLASAMTVFQVPEPKSGAQ